MSQSIFTLLFLFISASLFGQKTEIEGYLELFHSEDQTSVFIGVAAGSNQDFSSGRSNTFIGYRAGRDNTTGDDNSFFGRSAGQFNETGSNNSFFGRSAGQFNETGSNNSFFGHDSGSSNKGNQNSFFGAQAGDSNVDGEKNCFFGAFAGDQNTTGEQNSFYGYESGSNNTVGRWNAFFGERTGLLNEGGSENSFYGALAGGKNTTSWNSFFGYQAGFENTEGFDNSFFGHKVGEKNTSGGGNTMIGSKSGNANTTGNQNTLVGYRAGQSITGSNNIVLGANAGPTSTGLSDRLYIDISKTNHPLIFARFDTDLVRINGDFETTGTINGSSDINRKELITSISPTEILEKIAELPITEWQYKGSEERHIGPMAQDFYAAFGLGKGETTIATVDADGVALASIQALAHENQKLKKLLEEERDYRILLFKKISKMEELSSLKK